MIIVNIIVLAVILIGILILRSYEKDFLSIVFKSKKGMVQYLYPLSLWLTDHVFSKNKERESQRKELLKALYVGKNAKTENRIFLCKKVSLLLLILIMTNAISILMCVSSTDKSMIKNGKYVERPGYGEYSKNVNLHVVVDKGDKQKVDDELILELQPRIYSKKEFEAAVPQAKSYIKKKMLGENKSLKQVRSKLLLMSKIPKTSFKVSWELNDYINEDGTLNNKNVSESGKCEEVKVTLKSGEFEEKFNIKLTILPPNLSESEKVLLKLQDELEKNNSSLSTKPYTELPKKVNDHTVSYIEEKTDSGIMVLGYGMFLLIVMAIAYEHRLQEAMKKRELQLLMDYPELINRFLLLTNAGMTVKRAWEKIINEYQDKKREGKSDMRYAYEEMLVTWYELQNGNSETKAYESFGRRISLAPYLKFSSLLAQNVRKGLQEMNQKLESEAVNAFEHRKDVAKRLGEQASTKMLGPMMIMFGLVVIIIIVPAFISFNF